MNQSVGIINYGLGNISAFLNVYKDLGINASSISNANQFSSVSHLILPGVGSFDWAISRLMKSGLYEPLHDLVTHSGIPILGVCVGFQMMCHSSAEGTSKGLSWINAEVKHLNSLYYHDDNPSKHPLPHMGWNSVTPYSTHPIFQDIDNPFFYFLHSFYVSPVDSSVSLAHTSYLRQFCCSAGSNNVIGVQFHPEKSHSSGIKLLQNFAHFSPC